MRITSKLQNRNETNNSLFPFHFIFKNQLIFLWRSLQSFSHSPGFENISAQVALGRGLVEELEPQDNKAPVQNVGLKRHFIVRWQLAAGALGHQEIGPFPSIKALELHVRQALGTQSHVCQCNVNRSLIGEILEWEVVGELDSPVEFPLSAVVPWSIDRLDDASRELHGFWGESLGAIEDKGPSSDIAFPSGGWNTGNPIEEENVADLLVFRGALQRKEDSVEVWNVLGPLIEGGDGVCIVNEELSQGLHTAIVRLVLRAPAIRRGYLKGVWASCLPTGLHDAEVECRDRFLVSSDCQDIESLVGFEVKATGWQQQEWNQKEDLHLLW